MDTFEPDVYRTKVYDDKYRIAEFINNGSNQKPLEKRSYFYKNDSPFPFKTISTAYYDPENPEKGEIIHKYSQIKDSSYVKKSKAPQNP